MGNLYSVDSTGADLQQHTDHQDADGFVRTPSTDGQRIVYHARGDV